MKVALMRLVGDLLFNQTDAPLGTQIHAVIGVQPDPAVTIENFHQYLGIGQVFLNEVVTWNPNVTYHYAIMSAVRRYLEIVDFFPDETLVNGVPKPRGCSPACSA
jgi:hypothetical protein